MLFVVSRCYGNAANQNWQRETIKILRGQYILQHDLYNKLMFLHNSQIFISLLKLFGQEKIRNCTLIMVKTEVFTDFFNCSRKTESWILSIAIFLGVKNHVQKNKSVLFDFYPSG